jgi:tape measure domain-containing protein
VAGAAAGIAGAVAVIGGAVGGMGIKFNAGMEQSEIAWTTLLGSADAAKERIQTLLDLGAKTPFEFEGLDKSAKLLDMAGFKGKDLEETLVKVGDAVSAVGGGQAELEGVSTALFQMSAKGKISAEEMSQLAERGIPVWQILADKMGKSTQEVMKMSENGKLMAKDTIPLLVDGMGEKFGGAMDKQSKSFNGMMSTMWDNIKMISGELAKPSFNFMKDQLTNLLPILDAFMSMIKGDMVGATEILTKAFGQEKGLIITRFFIGIKDGIETAKEGLKVGIDFIKNLFTTLAPVILPALAGVKEGIRVGIDFIKNLFTTLAPVVLQVIEMIKPPLLAFISEIKTWWQQNGQELLANFQTVWNGIMAFIQFIMPVIKVIFETFIAAVKNIVKGGLDFISGLFKFFASLLKGDMSGMWEGLKQMFSGAIQFIWGLINLNFVRGILNLFKSFGTGALNTIKGMWSKISGAFTSAINSVKSFSSGMVNSVIGYFKNLYNNASRIFGTLKTFGANTFNALKQAVVNTAQKLWSDVVSKFNGMKTGVSSVFDSIKTKATTIFNNVRDAIQNPIKTAVGFVKEQVDKIVGYFTNAKIKFPKIPMPHFGITGEFSIKKKTVPKLSVEWYKKGGIFDANSPQVIGVGDHPTAKEAALPLTDRVLGTIGESIAALMPQGQIAGGVPINITLINEMDGYEISRKQISYIDELQGERSSSKSRMRGNKK